MERTLDPPSIPDVDVPTRIERATDAPRRRVLASVPLYTPAKGFAIEILRLGADETAAIAARAYADDASAVGHLVVLVTEGSARCRGRTLDRFDALLAPPGEDLTVSGTSKSCRVIVIHTGVDARARPLQRFEGFARFDRERPMRTSLLHRLVPDDFRDVLSPRDLYLLVGPTNGRAGVRYGISGPDLFQLALAGTPPGNGPALHVHTSSDELFVVLEGRYEIRWGDSGEHHATLGPYDAIAVPRGTNRTFTNVGDDYGYLLPVVLGVRDELADIVWLPEIERELRARLSPALMLAARLVGLSFRPRA